MTDYHDFTTIDTPKEERRRLNVGDIWINAATCGRCGETVRSKNRHDFASCSCRGIAVDGGSWYCKRSLEIGVTYTDASVPFADAEDVA